MNDYLIFPHALNLSIFNEIATIPNALRGPHPHLRIEMSGVWASLVHKHAVCHQDPRI